MDYFLAAENILDSDGKNVFLPRSGTKQVHLLLPLLFNTIRGVLTSARKTEKEIKGMQIGKEEVKLPTYHLQEDKTAYIENP